MNNLLNYIKFRICSSTNFQQIKAIQNCNIEKQYKETEKQKEEMWGWFVDPEEEYIKRKEQIRKEQIRKEQIRKQQINISKIKN